MNINMRKSNYIGFLYFWIHFLIEITSYYVVFTFFKSDRIVIFALIYDVLAFVPEGFYGMIRDIGIKINFGILGMIISGAAICLLFLDLPAVIMVVVVAIGNGMIHIQGAEMTLRTSDGKIFPSALFVSGGAFGLVIGRILAYEGCPIWIVLLVHCTMIIPLYLSSKHKDIVEEGELTGFNFADVKKNASIVVFVATFVVIVRSYMGYVIPVEWNDNSYLSTILLFYFMGIGKAVGGYLTDKIGIRKTILISTLGSLPFLVIGNSIMPVSLVGLLMFSMTMAIALALIVSVMKSYPGVAFGFTTVGLFIGVLINAFIYRNELWVKDLIVSVLAIVSCVTLLHISNHERK